MHCTRKVTEDIIWIGGSDRRLALFENIFPIPRGVSYNSYLLKDEKANKVYYYDKKPNDSAVRIETVYDTVKSYGKVSLLNIELITGKTHQIRAHLASCGHPLAGDIKYGAKKDENLKHYLLHSHKLCFGREEGALCGVSGKTIEALLPQEFYDYTDMIR